MPIDVLKDGDFITECNSKFGISKCFKKYCKPVYSNKLYGLSKSKPNEMSYDKIHGEILATYDFSNEYKCIIDYTDYYVIHDLSSHKVILPNIDIYPLNCTIIAYMIDNILILSDIIKYESRDISGLLYKERHEILGKLKIEGIKYDVIDLITIDKVYCFISNYMTKIPYCEKIININFINDNEIIYQYKMSGKELEYKIRENIGKFKFLCEKTEDSRYIRLLTRKIFSNGYRLYTTIKINEQYKTLLSKGKTYVVQFELKGKNWNPLYVVDNGQADLIE